MTALSRRSFLAGPMLAAGAAVLPARARAAAPMAAAQGPGVYRYKLGDYQLTALYDGIWYLPIDDKFVRNASGTEVNDALAAAFLPPSVLPISFTALLVNTGRKLVLIDTGTAGQITDSAGFMNANLAAAGVRASAIDTIVISHFHPDHIDGIKTKDGAKVFPNAEILVPEPEWTFWMDDANMGRATAPCISISSTRGASSRTSPRRCAGSNRATRWRPELSRFRLTATRRAIRPLRFTPAINRCWR